MAVSSRRSPGASGLPWNESIMACRTAVHIGRCTHGGVVFLDHRGDVDRRQATERRHTYGPNTIRTEATTRDESEDQIRPWRTARAAASARPSTSSLAKMWVRWVVTVRVLMERS